MKGESPNRFGVAIGLLLLWVIAASVGWKAIRASNDATLTKVRSHEPEIVAGKQNIEQARFAREQELRRNARDAADRRRAEFEQSLGGPLQAAFKNPDFSLREALQRATLACIPTNAEARVEVDRFTEFTITVSSSEALSTNQMAAIARQLLPSAKRYTYDLRFSVKGAVVAELDRSDIDFIDDWSRAPIDRVAMLLAREVASDSQKDSAAIDLLTHERGLSKILAESPSLAPKLQSAQAKLNQSIQKSFDDLSAALNLSEKAISLAEINKASEIQTHQSDLAEAVIRANAAKQFWTNPTNRWIEILMAEGVSGDALPQFRDSLSLIIRDDPKRSAKVFEALNAKLESSGYFLKLASEQFGVWRFDVENGQIGFTDEEYAKRFRRAQNQLIEDSRALEQALRAWNEFLTR